MQYDNEMFKAFRDLAITDASALEVGKTYYRNDGDAFTIKELLTDRAHNVWWKDRVQVDIGIDTADDTAPAWVVTTDDSAFSLHDSNVGASYNPWLIFANEALAKACGEMLVITWPKHEYDDYGWDDE